MAAEHIATRNIYKATALTDIDATTHAGAELWLPGGYKYESDGVSWRQFAGPDASGNLAFNAIITPSSDYSGTQKGSLLVLPANSGAPAGASQIKTSSTGWNYVTVRLTTIGGSVAGTAPYNVAYGIGNQKQAAVAISYSATDPTLATNVVNYLNEMASITGDDFFNVQKLDQQTTELTFYKNGSNTIKQIGGSTNDTSSVILEITDIG